MEGDGLEGGDGEGSIRQNPSSGSLSASVESSFTMIDRDSGSEDAGFPRRRRPKHDFAMTPTSA